MIHYTPPGSTRGTADAPILTPPPPAEPRINGARITGVRPGSPLLYRVAATGERPMTYGAENLPEGVQIDRSSGVISGRIQTPGTYSVRLEATNALGVATSDLRIKVGQEFALTPPMGFNTYGGWGPFVTEAEVRAGATAMISTGLADHGYHYVNIDDGWQGKRSGSRNAIQPNEKFGDLRGLCDDLHRVGFKAGIYSTPWTSSYEGFVGGSSQHPNGAWVRPEPPRSGIRLFGQFRFEAADAAQWTEWGFDYVKYDWMINSVELARAMGQALRAQPRDMVLELSNDAPFSDAEAYTSIAQMCRTTGDIVDVWDRTALEPDKQTWAHGVRDIWLQHRRWAPFNRPGHWNMPCPLRVGFLGGWDLKPLRPTRLTPNEQFSHLSLWALWSAPLIIGCPVERLDAFSLSLLNNDEVIAIDQDPLGQQARDVGVAGGEALLKDLENGDKALGLFRPAADDGEVSVRWKDLGLNGAWRVRDVWRQVDIGEDDEGISAPVGAHGVVLLRLSRPTAG